MDILTTNESEALTLINSTGHQIELQDAPAIARRLLALGPQKVILKLGDQGAYLADAGRARHFPGRWVNARDTTAAGDCFNGALAAGQADGLPIEEAIGFAIAAASISFTRPGAQASLPARAEVLEAMKNEP